jgi:methylmalonyl-CoA mutase
MLQKNKLDFSDFFSIPSSEWKRKILEELNTTSGDALVKTSETLTTKGFYASEDLEGLSYLQKFHEHYQVKLPRHWYTAEFLLTPDKPALAELLEAGVDALFLDLDSVKNPAETVQKITSEAPLSYTQLYLRSKLPLTDLIHDSKNLSLMKGCYFRTNLFETYPHSSELLLKEYTQAAQTLSEIPRFKIAGIDSSELHHNNAGPVKEIAYTISLALDLFDHLTEKQLKPIDILSNFSYSFIIGKNYFHEIAKLRAFRLVWDMIATSCDSSFDSFSTTIHCKTDVNAFSQDPYYNILHNTTEAMAAIIGGCDALTIIPFDYNTQQPTAFSSRISRNISLILKEEAYLQYVADPLAGSYMVESLTDQMAQQALDLVKDIEKRGGLRIAMERGMML